MLQCNLDTSVPDWIIEHPETLAVFREFGIDYCCGGKSLEFACQERGIPVATMLARIRQVVRLCDEGGRPGSNPLLASLQVGRPRTLGEEGATDPMDRRWTTGFFKEPVPGPLLLRITNLEGDGQADLEHHGGPDKAVLAYSAGHYAGWRQSMNNPTLPFGAFGENFTVEGLNEADVCIGDTWRIGDEAVVQISQPRQPCWKLARRWRITSLPQQVQQSGRTGWYFRVLHEGVVAAGMPLVLLDRPCPKWTVQRANHVMHFDKADLPAALELAAVPLLSGSWQQTLRRRTGKQEHDSSPRWLGENG